MTMKTMKDLNDWRAKYAEAREATQNSRRKAYALYSVTPLDTTPLTETAAAYIMDAARKMSYTAIKTVYNKECTPYLQNLMTQAAVAYHREQIKITSVDIGHDNEGNINPLQAAVPHNKRKQYGVMMKVPTYYTLELTDTGKEFMTLDTMNTTDFDDCVQVAAVELLRFCEQGLIQSFEGVWSIRRYVYRAVNRYLHEQRKVSAEVENFHDYCTFRDENGNETIYTGKAIEKRLEHVDLASIVSVIESAVINDKKSKIDKAVAIGVLHGLAQGLTVREIAPLVGVDYRHIPRYTSYLQKVSSAPGVYAMLHDLTV